MTAFGLWQLKSVPIETETRESSVAHLCPQQGSTLGAFRLEEDVSKP